PSLSKSPTATPMPKVPPVTPAFSVRSVKVPSRLFLYSALRMGFGGFQKSHGPLLTKYMSIQPSLSKSRNAHPGPRVSGRYRSGDIALSCTHSIPLEDVGTSIKRASLLGESGCLPKRVEAPQPAASQSSSR